MVDKANFKVSEIVLNQGPIGTACCEWALSSNFSLIVLRHTYVFLAIVLIFLPESYCRVKNCQTPSSARKITQPNTSTLVHFHAVHADQMMIGAPPHEWSAGNVHRTYGSTEVLRLFVFVQANDLWIEFGGCESWLEVHPVLWSFAAQSMK